MTHSGGLDVAFCGGLCEEFFIIDGKPGKM